MVIYNVVMIARQIQGEYVFVRTEAAYKDRKKAEVKQQELKKMSLDEQGLTKAIRVSTPQGKADCICEIGIHEVELED